MEALKQIKRIPKNHELKYDEKDEIFQEDMRKISKDFESVDSEGWQIDRIQMAYIPRGS